MENCIICAVVVVFTREAEIQHKDTNRQAICCTNFVLNSYITRKILHSIFFKECMGIWRNLRHAHYFGNKAMNLKLEFFVQSSKYSSYVKPLHHTVPICRIISAQ